jgi:hypothetical protein
MGSPRIEERLVEAILVAFCVLAPTSLRVSDQWLLFPLVTGKLRNFQKGHFSLLELTSVPPHFHLRSSI